MISDPLPTENPVVQGSLTWYPGLGSVFKPSADNIRVQAVRQHKFLGYFPDLFQGGIPFLPQAFLSRGWLFGLHFLPNRGQLFTAPVVSLFGFGLGFVALTKLAIGRRTNL